MIKVFEFLYFYKIFILLFIIFFVRLASVCDTYNVTELLACGEVMRKQQFTAARGATNSTTDTATNDDNLGNKVPLIVLVGEYIDDKVTKFRQAATIKIRTHLPSPHSELLLGVLIGLDDLKSVPRFNDVVRTTGTIHVIVVSGYNISLVFGLVISLIGTQYKAKNLITALLVTLIYAVISGFDPPVIRSWIMGTLVAFGKFYGRSLPITQVLIFSALVMLITNPLFAYSLSFQLSFLATLGLVMYSDIFGVMFNFLFGFKNVFIEDLTATVSAQLLVWPLISYRFEQVSLISPVVNALILWTIPLATILGGVFLLTTFISTFVAQVFSYIIMVPLDIFVRTCEYFATFSYAVVAYKPSIFFLFNYYLLVLVFPFFVSKVLLQAQQK